MALPKSYCFEEQEQLLAKYGQVIAHPARIRVLEYLLANGPHLFMELAESIPLSPNTVSNHLRLLERAGMIGYAEVYFGETGYGINPATCLQACQQWRRFGEKGEKLLAQYLAERR